MKEIFAMKQNSIFDIKIRLHFPKVIFISMNVYVMSNCEVDRGFIFRTTVFSMSFLDALILDYGHNILIRHLDL